MEISDTIAVTAGFISFCALGISVWLGVSQRNHNKLSVQPHLIIDQAVLDECVTGYYLKNNSLGPAIIKSFTIYLDGNLKVDNSNRVHNLISELNLNGIQYKTYQPTNGQAMAVKEEYRLLSFEKNNATPEQTKTLKSLSKRILFKVEYESIYKDSFFIEGGI